MGKPLTQQKRGKGSMTYTANTHKAIGELRYASYTEQEKNGVIKATIKDLHHSTIHSAPVAEIIYENGEKAFLAAPEKMKVSDEIQVGLKATVSNGNILPLKSIPEGTTIFNIESQPGDGGAFCRTAGASARIVINTPEKVTVELPSKKKKDFNPECRATIGTIAGSGRLDKPWLKAGKVHHAMRAKGQLYPVTSGVAMNAVDHPFGSGRGRHVGKSMTPPRWAPPGRNVGRIHARKTGRGGKKS
ncbi:MAG: 50S ribosomal protein L2 [Candidatus Nanoarchaeia archaeon]|nr:50S ribosomal protein L2 [Candidatus Nanoarchaeia archaeon]